MSASSLSYYPSTRVLINDAWSAVTTLRNPPLLDKFPDKAVLVVLDVIDAYRSLFDDNSFLALNRIVEKAVQEGVRIVFTRWVRTRPEISTIALDATDRKAHWSNYVPEGQSELIKDRVLVPDTAEILPVRHTNLFMHESFRNSLDNRSHLVICGSWTESCVLNTTKAAVDHGHDVTVTSDACAGHRPKSWMALFDIQLVYGKVARVLS